MDKALRDLTHKWIDESEQVIFNGDGYSDDWVEEAEKRGLPNLRTTPDALAVLKDEKLIIEKNIKVANKNFILLKFGYFYKLFKKSF